MFLDLIDSNGDYIIFEYEIKFYNQILDIKEIKQMDLISKELSYCRVE